MARTLTQLRRDQRRKAKPPWTTRAGCRSPLEDPFTAPPPSGEGYASSEADFFISLLT